MTGSGKAILVTLVALMLIGVAVFFLFFGGGGIAKGQSFRIDLEGPGTQVFVGQPFTTTLSYSNVSDQVLKNVRLSIELPSDLSVVGGSADERVLEETIGDVGPGSLGQRSFTLIAGGDGQAVKTLKVSITYETDASKAKFEQDATADISVGEPSVTLQIQTPEKIFGGENFDTVLTYHNNTSQELKDVKLVIDYPPAFQFGKADPSPKPSPNIWSLGTIPSRGDGKIVIMGNLVAPDGSFFTLDAHITESFLGEEYPVVSQTASIAIAASPLSLQIVANDNPNYVSKIGDLMTYTITYKNNSNVVLQNATISATLTGELFNYPTLGTNASFNSLTNTLLWIAANTPALAQIPPGGGGSVTARVALKSAFPIVRLSDKNYTLKVQAQMSSPTVPEGTSADKTLSVATLETKVGGNIMLDARGYYRDAASGILNSGQYPPRVNQPTQYTVHWVLTNYATDMTNVHVSAFLQSGSRFTGVLKNNMGIDPVYNSATGEVTWDIPSLSATKGVIGAPAEAIFQIENTPAINQVGQPITLLGDSKLTATDAFVGANVSYTDTAITTDLSDDPTVSGISDKRVQP